MLSLLQTIESSNDKNVFIEIFERLYNNISGHLGINKVISSKLFDQYISEIEKDVELVEFLKPNINKLRVGSFYPDQAGLIHRIENCTQQKLESS